jgi:MYXO-CTERM domain-containing protein
MADSFDLDIFGPHEDDLHYPYVAGAQFDITAQSHAGNLDQSGWTLTSSDPSVIAVTLGTVASGVGNAGDLDAQITAVAAGTSTLTLKDGSGNVLDSHEVTVAVPDRAAVFAQGLLLTGSEANAEVTQASVIAGGEATFLVRYYQGTTELNGNHVLVPTATGGVAVQTVSTSFAASRDFLQILGAPTPTTASQPATVTLAAASATLGALAVVSVDPSVVTNVSVDAESESGASKGNQIFLYAHAVDGQANDIYGVSFDWEINGVSTSAATFGGPTDLFAYNYDSSVTESVEAQYDGFSPAVTVHGKGGTVESTADVGCSVSGTPGKGSTSPLALLFGLTVLAGVAVTRRKRA